MTALLKTASGRSLAYVRREGRGQGRVPGLVFLGGFMSDMTGAKALALDAWAERNSRSFLRFDYSGHGGSSGVLQDGSVSDWAEDAAAAITELTEGPQVLVGSSMGGWIALLLARRMPRRIAGLVGIAAAPDFIRQMQADMPPDERARLMREGRGLTPDSGPSGWLEVWSRLIDDPGAIVLDAPLNLPFAVRLLHGTADAVVPVRVALGLMDHATSPDMTLTLVRDADHRFSSPACLAQMERAVAEVIAAHGRDGAGAD